MGLSYGRRGFSDQHLWVAETTQRRVAPIYIRQCTRRPKKCYEAKQRMTYAIPLEIVYLTPLHKWNPYNLTERTHDRAIEGGKRNGRRSEDKAYNGTSARLHYRIPTELFTGGEIDTNPADTVRGSVGVLDDQSKVREVSASGVRIMLPRVYGVGTLRTRWPIMPVHGEGGAVWQELNALKEIVLRMEARKKYLYEPPMFDNEAETKRANFGSETVDEVNKTAVSSKSSKQKHIIKSTKAPKKKPRMLLKKWNFRLTPTSATTTKVTPIAKTTSRTEGTPLTTGSYQPKVTNKETISTTLPPVSRFTPVVIDLNLKDRTDNQMKSNYNLVDRNKLWLKKNKNLDLLLKKDEHGGETIRLKENADDTNSIILDTSSLDPGLETKTSYQFKSRDRSHIKSSELSNKIINNQGDGSLSSDDIKEEENSLSGKDSPDLIINVNFFDPNLNIPETNYQKRTVTHIESKSEALGHIGLQNKIEQTVKETVNTHFNSHFDAKPHNVKILLHQQSSIQDINTETQTLHLTKTDKVPLPLETVDLLQTKGMFWKKYVSQWSSKS